MPGTAVPAPQVPATHQPGAALPNEDRVRLGSLGEARPLRALGWRLSFASGLLGVIVACVLFDRSGYVDNVNRDGVSGLDAVYYATVSLSTTGYGDITPVTRAARLVNVVVVTPARVLFLIILVGTTLEVLTRRTRDEFRLRKWRRAVRNHVVICGYGTKGRAAVRELLAQGVPLEQIVVVEADTGLVAEANARGLTAVAGSATRTEVLAQARTAQARAVIVATQTDETAVLTTLTTRELNPRATIVVAVREEENAHLMTRSGADTVVTTSATAGRLLGLATSSPHVTSVAQDLVTSDNGLRLIERPLHADEVGQPISRCAGQVLAVVRKGTLARFDDPSVELLQEGDRLVTVPPI